ncbi:glycoside hydrolase family 6 protein [Antribacter sp. KLBMP9083]|uniref:Glucanase n=1 Tax=Antribacter soli TaxID=2910976 RepID=A0AA41QBB0_9MICO|nr:glycoside hydrolase family 6 protein [Antribacter soli]MCF4120303.1 glycoside hydrolase family 6 protein [Antribacter soli]
MVRRRTSWAALAAALSLLTAGAVAVGAATSAAAAEGCSVSYRVTNQWSGGFQGDVTVTNLGSPVSSWQLRWTAATGQTVSQAWNATVTQSGTALTATNVAWNGSLGTGASASFGFVSSWNGSNPVPSAFTLNGVACTGSVGGTPTPTPTPTPSPTVSPTPPPTSSAFYVDPQTQAYAAWTAASGSDKALLEKIAQTPQSYWVGNWDDATHARQEVEDYTSRAVAAGKTPILTVYAIPGRDCGSHSGGGVEESEYAAWIDTIAAGIHGSPYIILEPDALAMLGDCAGQGDRVGFLQYAARELTEAGGRVYIDAGHSAWLSPSEAARRLNLVGFQYAAGFALNTSNYQTTSATQSYGEQVSALVGGRGYVIDTSRNGNGSNGEWCNPRGRALGERPAVVDDSTHLDALLWVKLPGESDGACNGGPAAGAWWQEIALELARNARW